MSYFSPEVIGREQLQGTASLHVPPSTPTAALPPHGGFAKRKPSTISLIITPEGQVYLNLDIVKKK